MKLIFVYFSFYVAVFFVMYYPIHCQTTTKSELVVSSTKNALQIKKDAPFPISIIVLIIVAGILLIALVLTSIKFALKKRQYSQEKAQEAAKLFRLVVTKGSASAKSNPTPGLSSSPPVQSHSPVQSKKSPPKSLKSPGTSKISQSHRTEKSNPTNIRSKNTSSESKAKSAIKPQK